MEYPSCASDKTSDIEKTSHQTVKNCVHGTNNRAEESISNKLISSADQELFVSQHDVTEEPEVVLRKATTRSVSQSDDVFTSNNPPTNPPTNPPSIPPRNPPIIPPQTSYTRGVNSMIQPELCTQHKNKSHHPIKTPEAIVSDRNGNTVAASPTSHSIDPGSIHAIDPVPTELAIDPAPTELAVDPVHTELAIDQVPELLRTDYKSYNTRETELNTKGCGINDDIINVETRNERPDMLTRTKQSSDRKRASFSPVVTCGDCGSTSLKESSPDILDDVKAKPALLNRRSSWKKVKNVVQCTNSFVQLYKKKKYPWVQLAGHQGNFVNSGNGTIMKLYCPSEYDCFLELKDDVLSSHIPECHGVVERDNLEYVLLQDLLFGFRLPNIMDIKVGVRTYLEDELLKASKNLVMRNDMYVKMIEVDPTAPTPEEHAAQGITKPRYMTWRETISSSSTLGFRIEGICLSDGYSSKDFKNTRTKEEVCEILKTYLRHNISVTSQFLEKLRQLRDTLEQSPFFSRHEVVGSSLLFVYDSTGKSNISMIDFGKSKPLPHDITIDHRTPWSTGNREDGYLIGVDNLMDILYDISSTSVV